MGYKNIKEIDTYLDIYPNLTRRKINKLYGLYYSTILKNKDSKTFKELSNFKSFIKFAVENGYNKRTIPIRKIYELGWVPDNIYFIKDDHFPKLLKPMYNNTKILYRNVYPVRDKFSAVIYIDRKAKFLGYESTPAKAYQLFKDYVLHYSNPSEEDLEILEERERLDNIKRLIRKETEHACD